MQDFTVIKETDVAKDAVIQLMVNMESVASQFSGTEFPTENIYDGMLCYRTDEGKYYTYIEDTKSWEVKFVTKTEVQAMIDAITSADGKGY